MRAVLGSLLTCLILLAAAGTVGAASLQGLQEAAVPVSDQSAKSRDPAVRDALALVLQRLTGQRDVSKRDDVAPLLDDAQRYLQQFRYESGDDGGIRLLARFDGSALRQALVRRGVRIWQSDRPPVLIWLAYDGPSQRSLVGADDADGLRTDVEQAMAAYGIPVMFPLMDLQDQRAVSFTDVTGGFTDVILQASDRYQTPLVLVGSLRDRNGRWRGRWSMQMDGSSTDWQDLDNNRDGVLAAAAQRLAKTLRDEYAVLPDLDSSATLTVDITGIDALDGYVRAERRLNALPGVTAALPSRFRNDRVAFRLDINVSSGRVLRALDRAPGLSREGGTTGTSAAQQGSAASPSSSMPTYRLER